MRILFIGNSHTYKHAMPFQVREMIRFRKGATACDIWSYTAAGRSLSWHGAEEGTRQAVRQFEWDYIVLQQATHPFGGYEELAEGYRLLRPHLEVSGAEIILYVTWKRKNAPESDQQEINDAFARLAGEESLRTVPAGDAWAMVAREHPGINLYEEDGSHASPAGSYLIACMFFNALTGESPEGLPARLVGRKDVLVDLKPETAERLQQTVEPICGSRNLENGINV